MKLLLWIVCIGVTYADVSHLAAHQGYSYTKPVPSFQIPLPPKSIPSNAYIPPPHTNHFEQPVQATVSIISSAPAPLPESQPAPPSAPLLPPVRAPLPSPPQVQIPIQSLPPVLAPPPPVPAPLPTPNFATSPDTQYMASFPQYPPVSNNEYVAPAPQYLPPNNYKAVSTSATNLPSLPMNFAATIPNPISHSSSFPAPSVPANEYLPPIQQYPIPVASEPAITMNLTPPVLPAVPLPQDYIPPPPQPSPSQSFGTVVMPMILQSRPSNEYLPPSVPSTNDLGGYHYQAPQK